MILNIRALAVLAALSLSAAACAAPTDEEATESEESTQDLASRSAYLETFQGIDGQYYFHLMAGNGQNVLRSEGYKTASGANGGVDSVLVTGLDKHAFDVKQAKDGQWYFNLVAGNNEVIGTSELYASKSNATRGVSTVRGLVRLFARNGGSSSNAPKAAPKAERFEIFTGEDKQSYFRLRAANGEIMLSSEGYASKSGAENGIVSVKTNGDEAASYEVFEAHDGQYGVKLLAGNGEVIAQTETYASKSNANRAVARLTEILGRPVAVSSN